MSIFGFYIMTYMYTLQFQGENQVQQEVSCTGSCIHRPVSNRCQQEMECSFEGTGTDTTQLFDS